MRVYALNAYDRKKEKNRVLLNGFLWTELMTYQGSPSFWRENYNNITSINISTYFRWFLCGCGYRYVDTKITHLLCFQGQDLWSILDGGLDNKT